jgi:carbon-monoxide dehydrogenase medium subunit
MSTLRLPPFEYAEPTTVEESVALLSSHGEDARVLAGGVDLLPSMRSGALRASFLVNIKRVAGLDALAVDEAGSLAFGATTTLHALELSNDLRTRFPALYDAIHQITSVQTKCMGTAVGNLCVATPASDVGPALAALDAALIAAGPDGERSIPVADFYVDYRRTALGRGEFVTRVEIPAPAARLGMAFLNQVRTHGDIAKLTVTASLIVEDGVCRDARIALGSIAPTMFRAKAAEASLEGEEPRAELFIRAGELAAVDAAPVDDIRSTATYRNEMAAVLVRRALSRAAELSAGMKGVAS